MTTHSSPANYLEIPITCCSYVTSLVMTLILAAQLFVGSSNLAVYLTKIDASFQDIYHGSEIKEIKVGTNSKRAIFLGGEKNLTRDENMSINMVVHIAAKDDADDEIR